MNRVAIEQLVARSNLDWDSNHSAGVSDCFTANGVFSDATGTGHEGPTSIGGLRPPVPPLSGALRRLTGSHRVRLRGPRTAEHRCYLLFVSYPDAGTRRLDMAGTRIC